MGRITRSGDIEVFKVCTTRASGTVVTFGTVAFVEEVVVHDQFDVSLEDDDLMGEVELTTSLMIAASEAEEPLSPAQIDQLLGVVPVPRQRG